VIQEDDRNSIIGTFIDGGRITKSERKLGDRN